MILKNKPPKLPEHSVWPRPKTCFSQKAPYEYTDVGMYLVETLTYCLLNRSFFLKLLVSLKRGSLPVQRHRGCFCEDTDLLPPLLYFFFEKKSIPRYVVLCSDSPTALPVRGGAYSLLDVTKTKEPIIKHLHWLHFRWRWRWGVIWLPVSTKGLQSASFYLSTNESLICAVAQGNKGCVIPKLLYF